MKMKKNNTELYKIVDIAKIKISDPVCRYHFTKSRKYYENNKTIK